MARADEISLSRAAWTYRRRMAFGSTLGAFAGLGLLAVFGSDTALHRTIAEGLITVLVVVVPSYIGAPVVDDYLRRKTPAAPPPLGPENGRAG